MTCIVGYTDGEHIWMGGDSLSSNSSYAVINAVPKVVRRETEDGEAILIGTSGDHRAGDLLKALELPALDDLDLDDWVRIHLVDRIREEFKAKGALKKENEQEEVGLDLSFMVGARGRLYAIWESFSAVRASHPYMAVGSGMIVALGAMAALTSRHRPFIDPEQVLMGALFAAQRHNVYVREPFHFLSTKERSNDAGGRG